MEFWSYEVLRYQLYEIFLVYGFPYHYYLNATLAIDHVPIKEI
jgi:hypothetical protein